MKTNLPGVTQKDLDKVAFLEEKVKNINKILFHKNPDEIKKFFDVQDKLIGNIKHLGLRKHVLEQFKILRDTAVNNRSRFEGVLDKLIDKDKFLE